MKKVVCLMFVVASALSIIGCGSGGDGGSDEKVSDKPAGNIAPSGDGGPKAATGGGGAGAPAIAPEPTPPSFGK